MLAVLKKLETRGNFEAARQIRSFASRVFRYGVATTRCKRDVAADLIDALIAPKVKHHAAILDPVQVDALLPAIRTKMRKEHLVPLTPQALTILKDVQKITGGGKLVFPGLRGGRPLSENTFNAALRRLG